MSFDENAQAVQKYGVGQSVLRSEDPVLVRGEGRYADDVSMEGEVHLHMLRSPHAHGIIRSINTDVAKAMKGVLAVFTQRDLDAAGMGEIHTKMVATHQDGSSFKPPGRPPMARNKVLYAGEIIACVAAKTLYQAQDAAEAIELDIEALPAVADAEAATAPGAPQLYDDIPNNVVMDYHYGDSEAVAAAFARAHHVARIKIRSQRLVVNSMEPRTGICTYDARKKRFTLETPCQGVKGLQANIAADVLKGTVDDIRVISGQIGGSFGMKAGVYPEQACLLYAARRLKKPVRWTDKRSESFVSDMHGRDHVRTAELALDKRGRFLAVRLSGHGNVGAYVTAVGPLSATVNAVKNVNSVYDMPLIEVSTKITVTNTPPVGPYRGAGRPEGNYFMERLIDVAAAEMGIDRVTLRRRNHIKPDAFPYKAASGMVYDSGDFAGVLDKALEAADWNGFAGRKAQSRKRGLLRGRGIGQFLEVTAPPGKEQGAIHFKKDGTVTILSGTMDFGMGHATTFAQVVVSRLGIPFDKIRLVQGDSDRLTIGGGSGGSKSASVGAEAFIGASVKVIDKGRLLASFALEAARDDIEFRAGQFRVAGTDRGISLMDLAARLHAGSLRLPADVEPSLDVTHLIDGVPSSFPNGCHVAEVEIDPETGVTKVVRYTAVNDCGTVINPLLIDGQMHGGVAQGIGQAIYEDTIFDENGQLLTGSFMDYCMPRADDLPFISCASHPVPAASNTLGIKGAGEAGCAGSLPAVMNAIVDALAAHGVRHIDMPASPQKIHAVIRRRD